jgi:hypothetical protein
MSNRYLALAIIVAALGGASDAFGQKETEVFVPIGQSPGVSYKSSLLGTVEAVDPGKRTLTVSGPAGARTVQITGRTRIFVDRSPQKQPNYIGALADLQRGRKVEIKLGEGAASAIAEWIKVQL